MKTTTKFTKLIAKGILVRNDLSEVLSDDGYISYIVTDGYKLELMSEVFEDWTIANYIQLIEEDDKSLSWCVQMASTSEDCPNTYKNKTCDIEARVYKLVDS